MWRTVASEVNSHDPNLDYNKLASDYTEEAMGALRQAMELIVDANDLPNHIDYTLQRNYCLNDANKLLLLAGLNSISLNAMGHKTTAQVIHNAAEFVHAMLVTHE